MKIKWENRRHRYFIYVVIIIFILISFSFFASRDIISENPRFNLGYNLWKHGLWQFNEKYYLLLSKDYKYLHSFVGKSPDALKEAFAFLGSYNEYSGDGVYYSVCIKNKADSIRLSATVENKKVVECMIQLVNWKGKPVDFLSEPLQPPQNDLKK